MEVLVTGGTGFVGSHLARALLARGYGVRLMGRDFSRVAALVQSGAKPIPADLRDQEAVMVACAGAEAVCHVGALSAPWGPRADFEAINVQGTRHVLEGCKVAGVRRLVHVSSPAVVFEGRDQFNIPDTVPYPTQLTSEYARTKQQAEKLVVAAKNALEVIAIRPKAIYGEGDTSLLPRIIAAAKAGRLPQIGNGQNQVDLTHVDDVVQAILRALEVPIPQTDFPVYTVTGGEHVVLWEAIRGVLSALGLNSNLRKVPLELVLAGAGLLELVGGFTGKEPRITRYSALILARNQTYDISRAQQDLGYQPRVPFTQGLARTTEALRRA